MKFLKQVLNDPDNLNFNKKLIKYQKNEAPQSWHKFHIHFRDDDYELFLDLRKILKMSLSLILASAVKKYSKEIEKEKLTDNYRFQNYIIIKEQFNCILTWRIFWGFPISFEKIFNSNFKNKST